MRYSIQKETANTQSGVPFKLTMEKEAVDPLTAASLIFVAKTIGVNHLLRHGYKYPGLRKAMGHFLGATLRAGAEGKPMLSRPTREIFGHMDAPSMQAYEKVHALGKWLGPGGIKNLSETAPALQKAVESLAPKLGPHLVDLTKPMSMVPKDPGRIGKVLDALFSPVSQVAAQGKMNSAVKILKQESVLPSVNVQRVKRVEQQISHVMFPDLVNKAQTTVSHMARELSG